MKSKGIKVMYNNINGFLSKKDSLFKIVESVDPDIIALCETKKAGCIKEEELCTHSLLHSVLARSDATLSPCELLPKKHQRSSQKRGPV